MTDNDTRVVIDGNDGTGKSTIVPKLRELGFNVTDRGAPTKMTDYPDMPAVRGERYIILDVPVEVSRERLGAAGKDLSEKYHTVEDLTFYRQRYLEVAQSLGDRCALIDSSGSREETLARVLAALAMWGITPRR